MPSAHAGHRLVVCSLLSEKHLHKYYMKKMFVPSLRFLHPFTFNFSANQKPPGGITPHGRHD